jgi:heme/copper-type cytochrome/quinol oxidase subunit 3
VTRMRAGEWVALAGAVALFVLMFFDWFDLHHFAAAADENQIEVSLPDPSATLTGWGSLGWFMDLLVGVLIFGGLALSYMTVKRASPAWPVGAGVLTWTLGSVIFLVLLVRVTITQPGPDAFLDVTLPAYLGLVAAALVPLGAFLSIRDERTASPEARAYTPPPPRSVPGT